MLSATAPAQLRLNADFDTGNLGKIVRIDSMHLKHRPGDSVRMYSVEVLTRSDPDNPVDPDVPPSERWFHFRMEGVGGKNVFLRIPNTEVRRPFFSYDGMSYMRFTQRENLIPQTVHTFFERDTVYIAYFAPYTHRHHADDMERWSRLPYATSEVIGYSGQGRPIHMLTVTDPSVPESGKRRFWIHARVHTSEAPASWHIKGFVEHLLDSSRLSAQIRRNAVFYIVPETNPDGVFGGYSRSTPSGVNLEINWNRPMGQTAPNVQALKRTIERLTADRPMDAALNTHSEIAPHITYWIHTAESTSPSFFRREMLLSALTMNHTPLYRPGDQSFSDINSKYPEGWFWDTVGDKTVALTFETPYTYYSNDPQGEWVTTENLARVGQATLLTLSDMFNLGGAERKVVDTEQAKRRGGWSERSDEQVFFGDSYFVSEQAGASATFAFGKMPAGRYEIFKWVPGPLTPTYPDKVNRWIRIGHVAKRKNGSLTWTYKAKSAGEVLDALLVVRMP